MMGQVILKNEIKKYNIIKLGDARYKIDRDNNIIVCGFLKF